MLPKIKQAKGFTLIELLVVIAIIAILAAILFPVFAKVREKARQTQCLSNEKQISLGVLQYVQDYDEDYPGGQMYGTENCSWTNEIQPYMKNGAASGSTWGTVNRGGVFTCPSSPRTDAQSYEMRGDIFPNFWTGNTFKAEPVGAVDMPAQKIMGQEVGNQGVPNTGEQFMFPTHIWEWMTNNINWSDFSQDHVPDNSYAPVNPEGNTDCPAGQIDWWGGCASFPRYRHNGTANFMFLDGHVKSMVKGQLDWYNNIYIQATDGNSFG